MTREKGKQGRLRNTWEDAADLNVQSAILYTQNLCHLKSCLTQLMAKMHENILFWGCLHLNRRRAAALHFSTWKFNELRVYLLCRQAMVATAISRNPTWIHYRLRNEVYVWHNIHDTTRKITCNFHVQVEFLSHAKSSSTSRSKHQQQLIASN